MWGVVPYIVIILLTLSAIWESNRRNELEQEVEDLKRKILEKEIEYLKNKTE